MNYYERVQNAIDFIESDLEKDNPLEAYANKAFMSISNFYRLFYAFVGLSVKEYIRFRRLSCAACELKQRKAKVIDVALRFCFESPEAFTRAFRRQFGITPMDYKKGNKAIDLYERIDLMNKYFDCTEAELEKYPDIKIVKELPPMRVAYYRGRGYNAELDAFNTLISHMKAVGIIKELSHHRIFGFDNLKLAEEHEYEVWVTVDDGVAEDEVIRLKEFTGGKYAVMSTTIKDIEASWKRFNNWLEKSRYSHGKYQWLEEHLLEDEHIDEATQIDLYLPITERKAGEPEEGKRAVEEIKAEIMEVEAFRLIGEKCITSEADNASNSTGKKLWDHFNKSSRKIRNVVDSKGSYGVIYQINDPVHPENYGYMAGLKVDGAAIIPEGLEEIVIQKGLYARFTYKSSLRNRLDFENIGRLYEYIYQSWLPQSQYNYNPQGCGLEYFETARLQKEYPEYDIFIPII